MIARLKWVGLAVLALLGAVLVLTRVPGLAQWGHLAGLLEADHRRRLAEARQADAVARSTRAATEAEMSRASAEAGLHEVAAQQAAATVKEKIDAIQAIDGRAARAAAFNARRGLVDPAGGPADPPAPGAGG